MESSGLVKTFTRVALARLLEVGVMEARNASAEKLPFAGFQCRGVGETIADMNTPRLGRCAGFALTICAKQKVAFDAGDRPCNSAGLTAYCDKKRVELLLPLQQRSDSPAVLLGVCFFDLSLKQKPLPLQLNLLRAKPDLLCLHLDQDLFSLRFLDLGALDLNAQFSCQRVASKRCRGREKGLRPVHGRILARRYLKAKDDLRVKAPTGLRRKPFQLLPQFTRHSQGVRGLLLGFHLPIIESF